MKDVICGEPATGGPAPNAGAGVRSEPERQVDGGSAVAPGAGQMVLVVNPRELPQERRVWGVGGTLPPTEREALDWLTFGRLMGWAVSVVPTEEAAIERALHTGSGPIILGCDPRLIRSDLAGALERALRDRPRIVIARADTIGSGLASLAGASRGARTVVGSAIEWIGPGPRTAWTLRSPLSSAVLDVDGAEVWATLNGEAIVTGRRLGQSHVVTLGCHPSVWRDMDGATSALFCHVLTRGAPHAVAWLDLAGTVVLRMDDPGGAQNVHFGKWTYRKMNEAEWADVARDLERHDARLSVGYTAGWVDDGDANRGTLEVDGQVVARTPGQVHPAPLVRYVDQAGHAPGVVHDYEAEYRGIEALRAADLGDVELHGYTHFYPNSAVWAAAADRYTTKSWYREFGVHAAPAILARPAPEHPISLGMTAIEGHFDIRPTTLICPGHQSEDRIIERALDEGLELVSQQCLAIRDRDRLCWTTHVGAPELDEVDAAWFRSGLPVVVFFHDRDIVRQGSSWFGKHLDQWRDAGATRFVDFRQLAAELGHRIAVEDQCGQVRVIVTRVAGAPPPVRPFDVLLRNDGQALPARVTVIYEDTEASVEVHVAGDGVGRIRLGPSR
jgi:hypothetical protein